MAEKVDSVDLAPLLECAICLRPYDNPLVLPCLHSFCRRCLKNHISAAKDESGNFECPSCRNRCTVPEEGIDKFPKNFFANSLKDTVPSCVLQKMESAEEESKTVPQCDHHLQQKVDWYCKTCEVPVCPYCFIENHKTHEVEKLSVVAESAKRDLRDLSVLAAQRIASLQRLARALKSERIVMEIDLDEVDRTIVHVEDSLTRLILQHAASLKDGVQKVRTAARKVFDKAQEELETSERNCVKVKTHAESLWYSVDTFPLCAVTRCLGLKHQLSKQQTETAPAVHWTMRKSEFPVGPLEEPNSLGRVEEIDPVVTASNVERDWNDEDGKIGAPIQVTEMEYTGEMAFCGIVVIHKTLMCVSHYEERYIWVYSLYGQLKRKVTVSHIKQICGLRAIDGNQGKLAMVDGLEQKVHLVTLSSSLKVLHHTAINTQFVPNRLSGTKELSVFNTTDKRVSVFTADGLLVRDITLDIPKEDVGFSCVVKCTQQVYVACNYKTAKVYFVDATGAVLRTSEACGSPLTAVCTSWGNVLVVDSQSDQVRVFSEAGDFLGNMMGSDSDVRDPYYIEIDEADGTFHVGCGGVDTCEVRTYKFSVEDLPSLDLKLTDTTLCVSVDLAKVSSETSGSD